MTSYDLSRAYFDWCFENPEKVSPNHTAIYFFAIEHCNRLGWKEKFGFPTQMAMDAIGIKKNQTYIRYFNDLVTWGFFKLIEKSKNQYSANIISLQSALPKNGKALDKALIKHTAKQTESIGLGIRQSNSPIDKPLTKNKEQRTIEQFEIFWNLYNDKTDKKKCLDKWMKLSEQEIETILATVSDFKQYKKFATYTHPNPLTYLNGKRWEDELPTVKKVEPKKLNQMHYFSYGEYVADCEKAGVTPEPPQI